jgi:hypothetical protein
MKVSGTKNAKPFIEEINKNACETEIDVPIFSQKNGNLLWLESNRGRCGVCIHMFAVIDIHILWALDEGNAGVRKLCI